MQRAVATLRVTAPKLLDTFAALPPYDLSAGDVAAKFEAGMLSAMAGALCR
jgi:hypothetical protein